MENTSVLFFFVNGLIVVAAMGVYFAFCLGPSSLYTRMDLSTQQRTLQRIYHPVHRVTNSDECGASLQDGSFSLKSNKN